MNHNRPVSKPSPPRREALIFGLGLINQKVKADLKDGILILTLPKLEQEQSKVFKVNLDQSQTATTSLEADNSKAGTLIKIISSKQRKLKI